ncbi:hypothetical protein DERP_004159 [Dermatophagoides pteronyssinus]|uniref:Uncharacterized protein n=1 Tax=Dermatophagoides pteronyssinus TaxID=6956 RepID=A0ABQ8J8G6_DERPT|nr:hypothetical protein DERP_004159 [Dermatophagoides pteronyssinus]
MTIRAIYTDSSSANCILNSSISFIESLSFDCCINVGDGPLKNDCKRLSSDANGAFNSTNTKLSFDVE